MLVAWTLLVATAVLSVGPCHHLFPEREVLGLKIWFLVHRTLLQAAWVINVVAMAIMIGDRGFAPISNLSAAVPASDFRWHPFFGLLAFCCMFVQPFVAFVRPGPDSPRRPLFRAVHFTIAVWAVAFAYAAIFYSTLDPNAADDPSLRTIATVLVAAAGVTIVNIPASFFSRKLDQNKVVRSGQSTCATLTMLTVQLAGLALMIKVCMLSS